MQDTIELLKECNSGVKMGVSAIDEVIEHVDDTRLESILKKSSEEHSKIGSEVHMLLNEYGESEKEPNPMAKGMSWLKTNIMLAAKESDNTVADLITDGCDMGIKSLRRYKNKYKAANNKSKELAQELIDLEEKLRKDMINYL